MRFPAGFTATVVRSAGRNSDGDPLPGTEHAIGPCGYQASDGEETTSRGDTVVYSGTLLAPADADVTATDQIRIDDVRFAGLYEVVGGAPPSVSPFSGWSPGKRIRLRDVEG